MNLIELQQSLRRLRLRGMSMAEAFVKTFKCDDVRVKPENYATVESIFGSLSEWFEDYNKNAPHKGLRMMSPPDYRKGS